MYGLMGDGGFGILFRGLWQQLERAYIAGEHTPDVYP